MLCYLVALKHFVRFTHNLLTVSLFLINALIICHTKNKKHLSCMRFKHISHNSSYSLNVYFNQLINRNNFCREKFL